MAIRLRNSNGLSIALCAVEADAMPGDRYLDDAEHYALAAKFAADGISGTYTEHWAEMERHKVRDAEADLNQWLSGLGDGFAATRFRPSDRAASRLAGSRFNRAQGVN